MFRSRRSSSSSRRTAAEDVALEKRTALKSAVKSREETPKVGITAAEAVRKKLLLHCEKVNATDELQDRN